MLLFVCQGNLCRSPMAEYLARQGLADRVEAVSAGTHAALGEPMHSLALDALAEVGVTGRDFRSQPLTEKLLASASLVLAASREQRAVCVRLAPSRIRRTFTLAQFARLVRQIDPDLAGSGIDTVLDSIVAVRSRLQPVSPADNDLADPVLGTMRDMRQCRERIQHCLDPVLAFIAS